MASLEQWEQRGKGPSGPTLVSMAFSAGVIALGVLLVKNGMLAPRTLTELNDPVMKRGWAPFFDVAAVGSAKAEEAAAETEKPQAPAAAPGEVKPQKADPTPVAAPASTRPAQDRTTTQSTTNPSAPQAEADPYAHFEEAPAPAAPTIPQVQNAPRVITERNTSVTEAPSPARTNGSAARGGQSTWGGERSPVEGR